MDPGGFDLDLDCYLKGILPLHLGCSLYPCQKGVQWLSGRVLDSRPRGCGLEPHRRHCVVVLEQDTFILV